MSSVKIFVFVIMILMLKQSNLQGTCEEDKDGKLLCINGIPTDTRGKTDITVKFTSNFDVYTIDNSSFENDTWGQIERLEITKSQAVHVTIEIMPYAFIKLVELKTLWLRLYFSTIRTHEHSFTGLINLSTLNISETQGINNTMLLGMFSTNESFQHLETLVLKEVGIPSDVFYLDSAFVASLFRWPIKAILLQSIHFFVDLRAFSGACGCLEYINLLNSTVSKYDKGDYQYDGVCSNLKEMDVSGMHVGLNLCIINRFEKLSLPLTESNLKDFTPFRNVEDFTYDSFCTLPDGVSLIDFTLAVDIILNVKYFRSRYNTLDVFDVTLQWDQCSFERVDLATNNISFLNPGFLSSCTQLTEINLAENRLSVMSEYNTSHFTELFKSLLNLSVVNLAGNGLKILPKALFSRNEMLTHLDLSNNKFTEFTPPLTHLINLNVLLLTSNHLNLKDSPTRRNLFEYLDNSESNKLLLADNPFTCSDCDDLEGIKWIVQNNKSIVDSENIHCSGEGGSATIVDDKTIDKFEDIYSWSNTSYYITFICIVVIFFVIWQTLSNEINDEELGNEINDEELDNGINDEELEGGINEEELESGINDEELEIKAIEALQADTVNTFAVFLSYSSEDKEFAKKHIFGPLNDELQNRTGIGRDLVFFSELHMLGGPIFQSIKSNMKKCKSMLFLLSKNTCTQKEDDDNWCIFEFMNADAMKLPVILMMKEKVPKADMEPAIYKYFKKNARIVWNRDETGLYQLQNNWEDVCSNILRAIGKNMH